MLFQFNQENIVSSLEELKEKQNLTFFEIDFSEKPNKSLLQELCIEIASRTPDAKEGYNKDEKNEGRFNPFVGAILLKEEKGLFKVFGGCRSALHNGEHGECGLLTNILGDYIVDGCEMYVSLEPCTQESRHEWTEPCCEIIKNRRIKKVTIGMLDPNPDVAGHGIRYLINNGIDVELFDSDYQHIVQEQNKKFSSQFGEDGDPRTNRKIARTINEYISDAAVELFVSDSSLFSGLKIDFRREADIRRYFYRKMIENRSIIGKSNSLMPFDVIDSFALFFYKNPYHVVDGASIRYYIQNGIDTNKTDLNEETFDGPLVFAFQSYYEKHPKIMEPEAKLGFIEMIGHKYGFPGKNLKTSIYHEAGINFIKDKFGENGLKIVREAFINAIIHRDYEKSHSFTRISFYEDKIIIENPVCKDLGEYEELKEYFKEKEFDSHVVNPKLMRFFQMMNYCERNSSGFSTFRYCNNIELDLDKHYILKTTLKFIK